MTTIEFLDPKASAVVVRNVAVFASDDESRPVLGGIHVEAARDGGVLTATDTFALATAILPAATWTPGMSVVLDAVQLAKFARKNKSLVSLAPVDDEWWTATAANGATGAVEVIRGDYPKWRQEVPAADAEPYAGPIALGEVWHHKAGKLKTIDNLDRAASWRDPVVITIEPKISALKPVLFDAPNAGISGVVMPVRI